MQDADNHYAVWRNPGLATLAGYEEYAKMDNCDERFGPRAIAHRAAHLIGTLDEIIERVMAVHDATATDHLIINIDHGGIPLKEALASLQLFAREVLPVVQRLGPPSEPATARHPSDGTGEEPE